MSKNYDICKQLWDTQPERVKGHILRIADRMLEYPGLDNWYEWGLWGDGFFTPWCSMSHEYQDVLEANGNQEDECVFIHEVTVGVLREAGADKYGEIITELDRIAEEGL